MAFYSLWTRPQVTTRIPFLFFEKALVFEENPFATRHFPYAKSFWNFRSVNAPGTLIKFYHRKKNDVRRFLFHAFSGAFERRLLSHLERYGCVCRQPVGLA